MKTRLGLVEEMRRPLAGPRSMVMGLVFLLLPTLIGQADPVLVLRHVTVVDVENGELLGDRTVEIAGGRITKIVPSVEYTPASGAEVLDLTGRYLIPGFIEMHAHVLLHPWDENGDIMPQYDREAVLEMLRTLLAFGVTSVRDPGAPTEAAVTFRDLLARGIVTGPRLFTAGRIITASSFNPEPFAPMVTEEDVRREVRWQAQLGVDFIKLYASVPPELAKVAIEEAHAHGLEVIGHLHRTTWSEAAELGIDALTHNAPWPAEYLPEAAREAYRPSIFGRAYWLEHVDLAAPQITGLAQTLAERGVAVDPTLIALHSKFWGNDPRYVHHPDSSIAPDVFWRGWRPGSFTAQWTDEEYATVQAQWPKALALARLFYDYGVLLTVGTDTPTPWIIPGVSFHEEMQLLADAGIPPEGILKMATFNGAVAIGREDELGRIQEGMLADLVVLSANPIESVANLRRIEAVFKGGVRYDPAALLD